MTETTSRVSAAPFEETRSYWRLMSAYERFEQLVAVALSLMIATLVVVALFQLGYRLVTIVMSGVVDPLDHTIFQQVFGAIFTVLIALEFKHSIIRVSLRRDSMVQVRTVLLIALLAMSRKFVILDTTATAPATIASLAGVTLVLGVVYWLLRDRVPGALADNAARTLSRGPGETTGKSSH